MNFKAIKSHIVESKDRAIGIFKILKKLNEMQKESEKIADMQLKRLAIYNLAAQFLQSTPQKIAKNKFLLFEYSNHSLIYDSYNLGDYVQTIATKHALESIFADADFEYFDRDNLGFYRNLKGEKIPCIMQGWFAYGYDFLPSKDILGIYIGTHFTRASQEFLLEILVCCPYILADLEIGCRDRFSLTFCQKYNIESYFSRCLTLSLPKREKKDSQNKVFLVDLPSEIIDLLPSEVKENAEIVSHFVNLGDKIHWDSYRLAAETLLERYKNEARLVITTRLHCANPCVAFGIPVILFKIDKEQDNRFSALDSILPMYSIDDLRENRVDFAPKALDIESLKHAMIENLKLSILKAFGENIDKNRLLKVREEIDNFKTS